METFEHQFEEQVVVIGVGLIGGSVAAAVRQRFPGCAVIGVGRSADRLSAAQRAGLLTGWTTQVTPELLRKRSIVVVCLPVDLIADQVCQVAAMAPENLLITDAGSVKGSICCEIDRDATARRFFVGAHPIAGGEQGGFEYAEANLFEGRVCVVVEAADQTRTARLRRFWEGIGCQIVSMTAEDHDRTLALTSHLPHVMAAVTTAVVGKRNLALTGSGFRDATRIAAGDAALWKGILSGNRDAVAAAIEAAEQVLAQYRVALEEGNDECVHSLLAAAAECRSELSP